MKRSNSAAVILGVLLGSLTHGFAQTNIQIIGVTPTIEQAIRLTWTSASNHTYEIDEADALAGNADGSTAWNMLYNDYPSQGTNTFWLDTGNYVQSPPVVHPKYSPMRFYQIVDSGLDTTSDEPAVSISSPANGVVASGSLTISVLASTDQAVLSGTKLYVDGQEMQVADSTTNYAGGSTNYEVDTYTINTCEWPNGAHTLFATTECESGLGDTLGSAPVAIGHSVSPFVPVTFNNLVTSISFSQPFFNPAAGQTQLVTAIFPLNVNWTLNIVDTSTNVVQTASGSGGSMQYGWDGTDTNGVTVPPGNYFYLVSACTNGLALPVMGGGVVGRHGGPPSPDLSGLIVSGPGSDSPATITIPLPPYPPGMPVPVDAQGNQITNLVIPQTQAQALTASESSILVGGASPDYSSGGNGSPPPNPQTNPPAPVRPPTAPVAGLLGAFGVCYDSYDANGTNGVGLLPLLDGSGAGTHISFQGHSAGQTIAYLPIPEHKAEANNFITAMQHWGWTNAFFKTNDALNIASLRGSSTPFNQVNLGVLLLHGVYGTSPDYAANQCKQMYFPISSGGSGHYLRLSEMNLGGAGPSGLKWMAIKACHSLYHVNWNSMRNAGIKPYNGNLHLLLGADTDSYATPSILSYWARYMNFGTSTNAAGYNPLTIRAAWYQAAKDAYRSSTFPSALNFVVAGDSACSDDKLRTNKAPAGNWFYDTPVQVWPAQ